MLFDTSDFPARWNCGEWSSFHGWSHILSDLAIAAAYLIISLTLLYYWWIKKSELAFPRLFSLFALFILSCGATHLIDAIIFHHPIYRFAALIKFTTAVASWATVIVLLRIAPKALELPGLHRANLELNRQLEITLHAEQALQKSNQDLQDFTGMVTHDLRNPLNSSRFSLDLAREALAKGDQTTCSDFIRQAADGLTRMEKLIFEFHSRSLSKEPVLNDAVPVADAIHLATRNLDQPIRDGAVRISVGELPEVRGNLTLLGQVFTNLIENSIKYHSAGDLVIRIEARRDGANHLIIYADNGPGIPPGDRERVFENEERACDDGIPGSGLGLAVCRQIMADHNGSIRATDNPSGRGACFEIRLPA